MTEFPKGARVELKPEARHMFVGVATGVVTGLSRDGQYLRVIRDGNITPVAYSPRFWQVVSTPDVDVCVWCAGTFAVDRLDSCVGCLCASFCDDCLVEHKCG